MKNEKFVIINGQKYDTTTGLPVPKSTVQPKPIHSIAQKSRALLDSTAKVSANVTRASIKTVGRSMDIARNKSIARFAPRSISTPVGTTQHKKQMDIGPVKHPMAASVASTLASKKSQAANHNIVKSASTIKQEAIAEALSKTHNKQPAKQNFLKRHSKFINIFTLSILLLVIGGYFTYLNMPSLSVRVASAQAGIDATYPDYHPDGYSLNGPVVYSNGQVSINFHANTGDRSFVIKQSKSLWDSSALKNQIDKESSGGTNETKERGLTIFSYDNNTKAAWVNGGILYSITGNAPLSGDQIRHIATSLISK